jgi:GT2 family glycosyltransferase
LTDGRAVPEEYSSWEGKHVPGMLQTCLFTRGLVEAVGSFDETMTHGEDNDFYLRLRESGMKLTLCDVDAVYYRRHAANASNAAPSRTKTYMDLVARRLARRRRSQQAGAGSETA